MEQSDVGGRTASKVTSAPDAFTVSINGPGVAISREVDQATALTLIATIMGGGPSTTVNPPTFNTTPLQAPLTTETQTRGDSSAIDPRITVGEYIDECEAKQFPAKITAIGNFLELKLGQSSFTREEVKSQFRPAGEAQPGNYSRDFAEAITQRWIAEDPAEKGQYFVTKTGKAAIAAKFDRSTKRSPSPRRRRSTTKDENEVPSANSDARSDLQDLDE
ncbi:hypothetical protein [Gordonia hongkongensis]|uniref:Uncharacterized protein n=1 Tax=Gordonia hongkongensis TaxID=1701090 RepID=A0ABT6BTX4_9ACTN|nr:hypothetical protein [Gordonia hongkongensis]MDF6101321.1 hypothetical protein [Gordonia hongkongensis]